MFTELEISSIRRIPTAKGIKAIRDGVGIGQTNSEIWIYSNENDNYIHYTAVSTYTGFDVPSWTTEKNGKACFCLNDHSATAIGYYKTKRDYLAVEDALKGAGMGDIIVADSFGHDGNCEIYLDSSLIKKIQVRN